ncbi:MAG: cupin domain-containing protein [Gemmatimonadota bacterium]|nr:cupin domain-containing protein [Gemmatimonadota bacterium]
MRTPWLVPFFPLVGAACGSAPDARSGSPPGGRLASPAPNTSLATQGSATPIFSTLHDITGEDETIMGDPAAPGKEFVVRIRELPGTIIPPHTHTFDEHLTVVQGTLYFGMGKSFDSTALHAYPTGSYIYMPRGTPMFGYAPGAVIAQVHGVGPFEQKFVDSMFTLSDTSRRYDAAGTAPTRFHFRIGDAVAARGASGTIRDGFALGPIVEYIVRASDNHLFMAQERELSRR